MKRRSFPASRYVSWPFLRTKGETWLPPSKFHAPSREQGAAKDSGPYPVLEAAPRRCSHAHPNGNRKIEIAASMSSPNAHVCPKLARPRWFAQLIVPNPADAEVAHSATTNANSRRAAATSPPFRRNASNSRML